MPEPAALEVSARAGLGGSDGSANTLAVFTRRQWAVTVVPLVP